jgi:hypothetical protein
LEEFLLTENFGGFSFDALGGVGGAPYSRLAGASQGVEEPAAFGCEGQKYDCDEQTNDGTNKHV